MVLRRAFEILIHTVAPWQNRSVLFSFVQFCGVWVRGCGDFDRSTLLIDAGHESALIPVELLSIDVAIVALAQDLLNAFEFFGEIREVLFVGGEDAFLDGFEFERAKIVDFMGVCFAAIGEGCCDERRSARQCCGC